MKSIFTVHQNQYELLSYERSRSWVLDMIMLSPHINTSSLPQTVSILQCHLPAILNCQCFNDELLPFSEEVKHTEIGHLFEHIMLEYLCQEKLESGYQSADFCGRTSWNWQKELRGTFHITINRHPEDRQFFHKAFEKSVRLMNLILSEQISDVVPTTSHLPSTEHLGESKLTSIHTDSSLELSV
jgi:hypothetical protein